MGQFASERALMDDKVCLVTVTGEIDIYTAPRFRDELLAAIEDGAAEICIDLAGIEFMDSTGLTVLISAAKRLNASGGRLVLAAPSRPVVKLLAITGLNQVFTVVSRPERRDKASPQKPLAEAA
jgi:anti-sigma B factor antagonist